MFKVGRRLKIFLSSLVLLLIIPMVGCEKEEIIEEVKKIQILEGAVVIENSSNYSIYNLNGDEYEKIDTEYIVSTYDLSSGNFLFSENGNIKVNYLGKEIEIEENKSIISPKLSTMGRYVSYFLKDQYLELKVKDLSKNENIDIKSNVAISGELVEWLNENTLIYYGIDNKKNNGIFTYNIEEEKESLIYKLENGFLENIKVFDNVAIFIQSNLSREKIIKIIDKNGEIIEEINEVEDVNDIEYTKDGLFILGKIKNNNYSLYKYSNNEMKRLIYDFPKIIDLEKGLSKDMDGNIIFVGKDNMELENIYMYKNDSINILDSKEGNYFFINVK